MASMEYGTLYGTTRFFMETTRNLNLNVEALKYHVTSDKLVHFHVTQSRNISGQQVRVTAQNKDTQKVDSKKRYRCHPMIRRSSSKC